MLPYRFRAGRSIGIEIKGSVPQDGEDRFWQHEPDNLRQRFENQVRPGIAEREITHLSVVLNYSARSAEIRAAFVSNHCRKLMSPGYNAREDSTGRCEQNSRLKSCSY